MSERGSLPNMQYVQNNTGLKSCWECANIRVDGFPVRWCVVYPEQHIYVRPDAELENNGTTFAETCPSYAKNPTLNGGKEWDEEGI